MLKPIIKHIWLSLGLFLGALPGQCQDSEPWILIPYRYQNLWGYADTLGNIKITPQFDSVAFIMHRPYGEVKLKGKQSIVSVNGKILVPFSDVVMPWEDRLFIVVQEGKKGLYNLEGEVLPVAYDMILHPRWYRQYQQESGKVIGLKQGRYFLISLNTREEKEIPDPEKGEAGLVLAEPPETEYITVPNISVPNKTASLVNPIADSIRRMYQLDSITLMPEGYPGWNNMRLYRKGKVGLWTRNFVLPPLYDDILKLYYADKELILAKSKGKLGLIDKNGNAVSLSSMMH